MGVAIGLPTTIGTSSCKINGTRFDETNWDELFKEVRELYNILIPWFQISRSSYFEDKKEDYDADYDSFYAQAEMLWVAVRCDRYFGHDMPHLYDLLRAHDNLFKDLFGISIHKFLKGIENIQFSLSQGL